MEKKYWFLLPEYMKHLGFNCVEGEGNGYYKYINDGTKHRNKDYNSQFPEPKGKVFVYVNFTYSNEYPFVGIMQDGDTRTVYNGIITTQNFFEELINSVR